MKNIFFTVILSVYPVLWRGRLSVSSFFHFALSSWIDIFLFEFADFHVIHYDTQPPRFRPAFAPLTGYIEIEYITLAMYSGGLLLTCPYHRSRFSCILSATSRTDGTDMFYVGPRHKKTFTTLYFAYLFSFCFKTTQSYCYNITF